MSEAIFSDEDERQEYELALLEGLAPDQALRKAREAREKFNDPSH